MMIKNIDKGCYKVFNGNTKVLTQFNYILPLKHFHPPLKLTYKVGYFLYHPKKIKNYCKLIK